jgi:hypothetical protein
MLAKEDDFETGMRFLIKLSAGRRISICLLSETGRWGMAKRKDR